MIVYAVCVWTPKGFGVATIAHDKTIADRVRVEQTTEGRLSAGAFVAPIACKGGE